MIVKWFQESLQKLSTYFLFKLIIVHSSGSFICPYIFVSSQLLFTHMEVSCVYNFLFKSIIVHSRGIFVCLHIFFSSQLLFTHVEVSYVYIFSFQVNYCSLTWKFHSKFLNQKKTRKATRSNNGDDLFHLISLYKF